jgi:hypothetical protein
VRPGELAVAGENEMKRWKREGAEMAERRIDPDPFTIISAVTGIIGAAAGVGAYWRHRPPPPASQIRRKIIRSINDLDSHMSHLETDLNELESVFGRAQFTRGRFVRLGNGATLSLADFHLYERVSDDIFDRLRKIHRVILKLEKQSGLDEYVDENASAKHIDEFNQRLERLVVARDLSVEQSWKILREAIEHVKQLCEVIRRNLS